MLLLFNFIYENYRGINIAYLRYKTKGVAPKEHIKEMKLYTLVDEIRNNYPVLSAEEQRALFFQYRDTKDKNIKDKLVLSNVGLVLKAVHSLNPATENDAEDWFDEGVTGLMKAIEEYDVDYGTAFSTYAYHWIRQRISRCIQNEIRMIRIPVHMQEKMNPVKKYIDHYISNYGCEPSDEEIMKKNNISITELESIRYCIGISSLTSLNTLVSEEEKTELMDLLYDETAISLEKNVLSSVNMQVIMRIMSEKLSEKEYNILIMRFMGINNSGPMTLEEIGKLYGLSRERIRQIESKAKRKLRHSWELKSLLR